MKTQESKFTRIRKIAGGKYSLTLSQVVINPNASLNVLALMNASDEKFAGSQPKSRQCFVSGTAADIKALYGIDVDALAFADDGKGHSEAPLNIVNPTIMGYPVQIQLTDSTEAVQGFTPKNVKNKTGEILVFVDEAGRPIYQRCEPSTNPKHKIIESAERVVYTQAELDALTAKNREAALAKAAAKKAAVVTLVP